MKRTFDGSRIRSLRQSRGLTQQEFADKIGVQRQHISMYEKGRMAPQVNTLLRIIDAFKLPGDYFFAKQMSHSGKSLVGRET